MPTITPFLWFDTQAEEAMNFYASIFERSKVISRQPRARPGDVRGVRARGTAFMALNAGPQFKFTEAISFFVGMRDSAGNRRALVEAHGRWGIAQPMWLAEGQVRSLVAGRPEPTRPDAGRHGPARAERVMNAMLQMENLDLNRLQQAYDGA